jgi:hypothetical protein
MNADIYFEITNNALFVAMIVFFFTWISGKHIAKRELVLSRKEKRKTELEEFLYKLQDIIDEVHVLVGQTATHYKEVMKLKNLDEKKKGLGFITKTQIPKISTRLFAEDQIPALNNKIAQRLNVLFPNDDVLTKKHEAFKVQLKKWHEFFANYDYSNHLDKNILELENLVESKKLEQSIRNLIKEIQKR